MTNGTRGGRTKGLLAFAAGFLTMVAGYATWTSPQLTSDAFVHTLQQFVVVPIDELSRMVAHPFYFIGFIVLSVGIIMTVIGVKKAISS